jgi:catechol 2,3-dioxygenase-like lactoylglutathione lyase family enzyme
MPGHIKKFLGSLVIVPVLLAGSDETAPRQLQSAAPVFSQNSMNVFRRFAGDANAIYEFYGKVLGLKQLTTFNLGGNTNVARFDVGSSQVKFSTVVPNRKYQHGAISDATGVRLLTFFLPSQAPLAERFRIQGLPVPEFRPIAGSKRSSALVQDPDGQWVELVIAPDEPPATYEQIEIGLVVSDLAVSRKFYREFVGLEELPPVEDTILHTTQYPYRHGSTIISLRSFGKPLPADTGSGGIQYVVSDVKAGETLAKARQVTIAQPLSTLPGFGLKTIWFDDPDGITNYFAEVGQPIPKKQ